ncbi:hypothetical protein [Kordiimonas aestuarii]|uniref:hypothetical protein n=1 Tax=Kordiimonas aestuarii TaxID=1005925 RepID=UPI0021CF2B22|nr:hypothetical protein [Kordiimonas aestuarii]
MHVAGDILEIQSSAERFAVLKAMYFSGRRDATADFVATWEAEAPTDPFLRYLRGFIARHQLAPGHTWAADFEAGFDCGLRHPDYRPSNKRWHGEPLGSSRIAIWAEDGLGDFIRHAHHLDRVINDADSVTLHAPAKILPLLEACFPSIQTTAEHADIAKCDWHIPSGSLDGLFWHPTENPQGAGYLRPQPIGAMVPKTAAHAINVGVCSRSTKLSTDRNINYTTLETLAPIFQDSRYQCHSLQYRDDPGELAAANQRFAHPVISYPEGDFFDDLLALSHTILSLDLVLATSTMVADLASALGVPTIRFHGIPTTKLGGSEAKGNNESTLNPDHCWYSARTTILYRQEHRSWPGFFGEIKSFLDETTRPSPCARRI